MVLQKNYDYKESLYPQVVARAEDLCATRSFLIDSTKITSYTGADGVTQRLLPPGTFGGYSGNAAGGKIRALARTLLGAALVASTTTTFAVSAKTAQNFIAADALAVIAPYAIWTVTGTWAANDTGTITVNGRGVVFTAANATLADIAVLAAAAVNADPILKQIVKAIASGAAVYVYALDMRSTYAIATADTAGSGTLPITGSLTALAAGASIGTIATGGVSVADGTLTLTAASSISLPVGFPIGVLSVSPSDLNGQGYGLFGPKNPLDLEWGSENIYGAYDGGTFYRDRLPYWDGELARLFPEIRFQ